MEYLTLKCVHIISATLLFGTGLGSAFYMLMANRSKDIASIAFATRFVVIADWLFTMPAVIVQLVSGIALMHVTGYSLAHQWIHWGLVLYFFVGICWLPVVWMQINMRNIARVALQSNTPLPARYWQLSHWWMILGCLAFPAVIVVFYLMVFKPV